MQEQIRPLYNNIPMPITHQWASFGTTKTATVKQLSDEDVAKRFASLPLQEQVNCLARIPDGLPRQQFFDLLPEDAQLKLLLYIKEQTEKNRKESYDECVQLMDIVAASTLDIMLICILLIPTLDKLFKKCEYQNILKDGKYKFKLPKYYKTLKQLKEKIQPACIKMEGGVITQMMTQCLPHWYKDYDNVGDYYFRVQMVYPEMMKKHTDKLYMSLHRFCERFTSEYVDIATTALLVNILSQVAICGVADNNIAMSAIRNETKLRKQYEDSCKRAKERGTKKPKWVDFPYVKDDLLRDIAFQTEQICAALLGKEYMNAEYKPQLKNAYDTFKKVFNNIDTCMNVLNEIVLKCVNKYIYWYLAKMVLVVKHNEGMPQGVKDDVSFLFQSKFGYVRVMKDIHKLARVTTEDDSYDLADEIQDITEKDKSYKMISAVIDAVMAVRNDTMEYDTEYLKRIHDNAVDKMIVKTLAKLK